MASKAGCSPKEENIGMREVALLSSVSRRDFLSVPHLILPQIRGWGPVEQSCKKEGSDLRLPSSRGLLTLRGDQIVRPNPVNGHDCAVDVLVGECLHNVCNALASCFGGQGALEGSSGLLGLFLDLFGHGSHHQTFDNVSNDNPPHTSIRLG